MNELLGAISGDSVIIQGTSQEWLDWLTSRNQEKRKEATLILGALRPRDHLHLTPFITALRSGDKTVVFWSVIALGRLRSRAHRAIFVLRELVHHSDSGIRQAAVNALSCIGPADPLVKAAVFQALKDNNAIVRRQALQSMMELKNLTDDDLTVIRALANDADENVARWSEITIRNIRLKKDRDAKRA